MFPVQARDLQVHMTKDGWFRPVTSECAEVELPVANSRSCQVTGSQGLGQRCAAMHGSRPCGTDRTAANCTRVHARAG